MKVVFNTLQNNYKLAFCNKQNPILPEIAGDSFSILDKYNKEYKNSYKKDIIPDLKEYIKKYNYIKESDIKGILADGGLSIIFDLGEKEVLKCSLENPLEYRKHYPEFDIPFFSPVINVNKTYIVKQPKAETNNITIEDCRDVISRIRRSGLGLSRDLNEYRTWQVGKYNGKSYLLDTRCAVLRPNAFSRFIYWFCNMHTKVVEVRDMRPKALEKYETELAELVEKNGPQVLHINEAPMKNLSFREGISKIGAVMKENMKYKKFPL